MPTPNEQEILEMRQSLLSEPLIRQRKIKLFEDVLWQWLRGPDKSEALIALSLVGATLSLGVQESERKAAEAEKTVDATQNDGS